MVCARGARAQERLMNTLAADKPKIAVLIPCHNEAATIAKVIADFRAELPDSPIYVFDNCCTDATAEIARRNGAIVLTEPRKGKGFVVESMFDRIDADGYVMVDGDDTYDAARVHDLLAPVLAGEADMTVGARLAEYDDRSFRHLHVAGNGLVRGLINFIFHTKLTDILSGYRAFNGKVVRHVPVVSAGFEVETELTIQMLYLRLKVQEVQVPYRGRPEGSVSKLRTFHDGFRVLWTLFNLFRTCRPMAFFGSVAVMLLAAGIFFGIRPIQEYMRLGRVVGAPRAVLASGLVILSAISAVLGLLLDAINCRFRELHNVLVRRRR